MIHFASESTTMEHLPSMSTNHKLTAPVITRKYTGDVKQVGPKEIKVLITNHCPDCDDAPGHFDINQEPQKVGWNNPRIFWKKLDYTECM